MATFPIAHRNSRNTGLLPNTPPAPRQTNTSGIARITFSYTAGDELTLRGIPAIGRGVQGAIRYTRPEDTINRSDR
jgi:hypothetical protein